MSFDGQSQLLTFVLYVFPRKDTAASGSYVGVITITSFFLWYRPIYLGYAKENGLALFFCELHPYNDSAHSAEFYSRQTHTSFSRDGISCSRSSTSIQSHYMPFILILPGTAACSLVSHVSPNPCSRHNETHC